MKKPLITSILLSLCFITIAAKPQGTIYYSKCDEGVLLHIQINRAEASQRGGVILNKTSNYEFIEYRKTAEQNYQADFFTTSDQVSFQWNTLPTVNEFTVYLLLKGAVDLPIKKIKGVFYYVNEKGKEKEVKLKENKKEVKNNPVVILEETEEESVTVENIDTAEVDTVVEKSVEIAPIIVKEAPTVEDNHATPAKVSPTKNKQPQTTKETDTKSTQTQVVKKVTGTVVFKVQVAARLNNNKIENAKNYFYSHYNINHIEEEIAEVEGQPGYKYISKSLPTYRQAQLERDIYVSKGVIDAFIVGYIDGKRVDIQTAINAQKSK